MAQLQDEEVGDGTTSVVIVAAELLKNADELVKQKIHQTSITMETAEQSFFDVDSLRKKFSQKIKMIESGRTRGIWVRGIIESGHSPLSPLSDNALH